MSDPYQVVRDFEKALAEYTGAPFVVTTDSCTSALMLCCAYLQVGEVSIPRQTYISVPMAILNAGGKVQFDKREWKGWYALHPTAIIDSALHFTSGMYRFGLFQCVSFHYNKHLKIGRGGAILLDSRRAAEQLKLMRFNGRAEIGIHEQKDIKVRGWNCYMTPEQAARGLRLLSTLPKDNPDIEDTYPDISQYTVFKNG